MRRRFTLIALAMACAALAGCGAGENNRAVGLRQVPLPGATRVSAQVRVCDPGANAYCSEQLVVVGDPAVYPSSADLLDQLNQHLRALGWTISRGDTGKQLAAESPGHELRLSFDTAYNDLLAIDSSWIRRSPPIGRALSAAIFARRSALSLMLQRASS